MCMAQPMNSNSVKVGVFKLQYRPCHLDKLSGAVYRHPM